MIVLVNDDGIDAAGMKPLYRALREQLKQPVLAVAPTVQRSGHGHAITLDRGLAIQHQCDEHFFGFAVDGTPTDCLKIALKVIAPMPVKLVVSGINDGPNVGRSLFYSGTVGAAMEAAVEGYAAIAVSLDRSEKSDWQAAAEWAAQLAHSCYGKRDLRGKVVNANIPAMPRASWKETKIVPHGLSGFEEQYVPRQRRGNELVWHLSGKRIELENEGETDAHALRAGHPTITMLAPDHNVHEPIGRRFKQRLLKNGVLG